MKKLITPFILIFCLVYSTFAQDTQAPYFVKTYQSTDVKNINVQTSGGGISVVGNDEKDARLEVYVKSNNGTSSISKEEIENRLKDYELSVKKEGTTIFCVAKRKRDVNNWKNGLSISFKIYSPVKVSTDLETSGGGIKLKNLSGNQEFTTSGGGLSLSDLDGNIKGYTSGGGIDVSNCSKNIDLQTSGGGIRASACKGNIKLNTSGGSLDLQDLDGTIDATTSGGGVKASNIKGDFETSTSGGSIKLDNMMASIKASTSGGGISANIKSFGKHLSLSTSAGSIRVNMPLDKGLDLNLDGDRVSMPTLSNFSGKVDKDEVKGSVNGGGIAVSMHSSAGGVYINN